MAGPTLAKAYVTIIPAFEQGIQRTITNEIMPAATGAGAEAGAAAGTSMAGGMASKLKAGLAKYAAPAAIAAGVAAGSAYLYKLGDSFDQMFDTIRVGTGATGDALEGLKDDALAVMSQVPDSMEEIGQVVADLNTRLGISGDELQHMAQQYLEAGNILGSEVDVSKTTAAFNAFHLEGQAASDALDDLFTVAQSTGASIDKLASDVSSNAAAMQTLGFSFQDTAAMAGMLDKAGISASSVFSKMSKGLVELAKDGEEPAEAFQRLTNQMQELVGKGQTSEAIDLATQLFGTRGAAQFVGAIESGALAIDDLTAALEGNGDAILATADDTRSLKETLQIMGNAVKTALEPLASGIFQGLSDAVKEVVPYIQEVATFIKDTLAPLFPEMEDGSSSIANILSTVLVPVLKVIITIIGGIIGAIGAVIGAVSTAVREVVQFVKDLKERISQNMDAMRDKVKGILDKVTSTVEGGFNRLKNFVVNVWQGIKNAITNPIETAANVIKGIIDRILGFFHIHIEWPHIPLPHFQITPAGWKIGDLLKGTLPHLGIEWYASGGIVNTPSLVGVGEAGPEAIVPLRGRQMQPFAEAVAEAGGNTVYNVTIDISKLRDLATLEDIANVIQGAARAGQAVRA